MTLMSKSPIPDPKKMLIAVLLVMMFASPALTQAHQSKQKSGVPASTPPTALPHPAIPSISTAITSMRGAEHLRLLWGIDDIHIRYIASGALIRFSYRVVDAEKAKILNDKKATPYLVDEKNSLALQVPTVEQVGQLRQVATPQNGREYWMTFSNKGHYVTPGSHVAVIIGPFRAEGLVVEGIPSTQAR